jgi:2-dehydropantoate 2-reductase
MGAGSVGCYVGGSLRAAGCDVTFIGRAHMLDRLRRHGLALSSLDGQKLQLRSEQLDLVEAPPPRGAPPSLVLLTVKSAATADAAAALARVLPAGTPVLSLQNGIGNVQAARQAAPVLDVIAGMVPFNVAEVAPGAFHRGTSGRLTASDDPRLRAWATTFDAAGLTLDLHADMYAVQWAKLLLNLNNPVNALSGLPLRDELLDRGYRRVLAALQCEALALLEQARIKPARLTPLPPRLVPWVLRLPTPLFRAVAARMLRIDAQARSSMADDLANGRVTEIDALCGEVVRLAEGLGRRAPLNARMVGLVKAWPMERRRYSPPALRKALGL